MSDERWRNVEPTWCYNRRSGQNCYCDMPKGHEGQHLCRVCNIAWGRAAAAASEKDGDENG